MAYSTEVLTSDLSNTFKIGVVSRITNIPVDTLRIWERRYSVVVPCRSEKADRLYKREDINRLTLLKLLVDKGHSIGTIAKLNNEELSQRLEFSSKGSRLVEISDMQRKSNVVAIGDVLSLQLEYSNNVDSNFYFSGIFRNEEEFHDKNKTEKIDMLVMEFPTVQGDHVSSIEKIYRESGASQLILIYGFMNNSTKKKLSQNSFVFFQAPISTEHLKTEIRNLAKNKQPIAPVKTNSDVRGPSPKKIYTTKQLIQLSSASSTIKCECPQHLSSIIIKLLQFEAYSEECITRYKKDAELHRLLGNMTGHARSILEKALTEVVTAENIVVEK
ncbi:MAG: hypothetical protein CMF40_02665 [Legionellales bacterium]|nr:hypothetical protein [Legionellales bacterium]